MASPEGPTEIFLSCFKCGRIVKSSDSECPRCGMQFGSGTLFECPFCSGLIWRNASVCSSCGTNLTEFSAEVGRACDRFDMDQFVDTIIATEMDELKSVVRRVACPGCGLMIRGDEDTCPRCDLPLTDAKVDCPVCGEKISISSQSCEHCKAVFEQVPERPEAPEVFGKPQEPEVLAPPEPIAVEEQPAEPEPAQAPSPEPQMPPRKPKRAPAAKKRAPAKKKKKPGRKKKSPAKSKKGSH